MTFRNNFFKPGVQSPIQRGDTLGLTNAEIGVSCCGGVIDKAGVAQLVERLICNQPVGAVSYLHISQKLNQNVKIAENRKSHIPALPRGERGENYNPPYTLCFVVHTPALRAPLCQDIYGRGKISDTGLLLRSLNPVRQFLAPSGGRDNERKIL